MRSIWLLAFIVPWYYCSDLCPNLKTDLGNIRKRRHLVFPDGSNFLITISLVKAFMTHAPSGWNTVLEFDTMFPLPTANITNALFRKKLHHKQKRDIWQRLQEAVEIHNFNGRACIVRSICEAQMYLLPKGYSMVHDVLRAVFSAPLHESEFKDEITGQYDELLEPDFCERIDDCPVSLLNFIMALNKQKY